MGVTAVDIFSLRTRGKECGDNQHIQLQDVIANLLLWLPVTRNTINTCYYGSEETDQVIIEAVKSAIQKEYSHIIPSPDVVNRFFEITVDKALHDQARRINVRPLRPLTR
jgi:hypothetical protein